MKSHGVYGPSPWTLVGPFTWIVGTLSPGSGGTITVTVYMGMGIGIFNLSWALRLEIGIDVIGGVSLPIYIHKKDNC